MMRVCGPICPHSSVLTHAYAAQGPKVLDQSAKSGDLDVNGHATWGMPVKLEQKLALAFDSRSGALVRFFV